jgi:hypothetical protein
MAAINVDKLSLRELETLEAQISAAKSQAETAARRTSRPGSKQFWISPGFQ